MSKLKHLKTPVLKSINFNPVTANQQIINYNLKVDKKINSNTITLIEVRAMELFLMGNKYLDTTDYNDAIIKFNRYSYLLKQRLYKEQNNAIAIKNNAKTGIKTVKLYNLPSINQPEFSKINKAYKAYVLKYNDWVLTKNKSLKKYNEALKRKASSLNAGEQNEIDTFISANKKLLTKDYNKSVKKFNAENKKLTVYCRLHKKLKPQHKLTFQTLLGFFNVQFTERFKYYRKIGNKNLMPLPAFRLTYGKLAKQVGYDSKKTGQNHVKQLREAGIISDYKFRNSQHPVEMRINEEILTIFEAIPLKKTSPKNQTTNTKRSKFLHHDNDSTRTILKRNKKKENVDNIFSIKGNSLSLIHNNFFYKNTTQQNEKNKMPAAENFSDYLQKFIIDNKELAKNLTNHQLDNYKPIDESLLMHEIKLGTMSRANFRQLILQEKAKYSAILWKYHNVYEGNWLKTLYFFEDTLLYNPNGAILRKETMLESLKAFKWRIDWVKNWCKKVGKTDLLFPFQYFDPNRKHSVEVGFRFTGQKYRAHLKSKEKRQKEAKNRIYEAGKRHQDFKDKKKVENAIKRYTQGKYSLDNLYTYFQENLSVHYQKRLPDFIKNYS